MNWFWRTFSYSVGKKLIMALTGLFLVVFLIEHLIGNLLILYPDNGAAFNEYSHALVNNVFIRIIEVVLFICFAFHIVDGLYLYFRNRTKRPHTYAVKHRNANSFWTARNMAITGSLIFIFLIIHLKNFFVPYRIRHSVPDLYQSVVTLFSNKTYCILYIIAMLMIGLHLHHAVGSAFQTLGMRNRKYFPFIRGLGLFLAIVLSVGFAIIPLYFLITK